MYSMSTQNQYRNRVYYQGRLQPYFQINFAWDQTVFKGYIFCLSGCTIKTQGIAVLNMWHISD